MKLTDTQLIVLSAALNREDHSVLPMPDHIKGGAIAKVCTALLAKGLIAEVAADSGDPVWREADDGVPMKLVATNAACEALGVPSRAPAEAATIAVPSGREPQAVAPTARKEKRTNTKQAQLIDMLSSPGGASIEEIVAAFGWLPHTVRGAIAGALKKKFGLKIASEKIEGRGRVYRIVT